ncbi:hypothetical protein QN277_003890 [Acacia crassicarpa]|uniref:Uncharacterized protein n=1 Tax=Acacia crassicarpa TaxID=499986 RepID=A0AAE1K0A3_9FABA|nr:hypothetical protein QN277_003890 [Acacia crassicarpa]
MSATLAGLAFDRSGRRLGRNGGEIFDAWGHVTSDANAIQTPPEVFKSLESDGFPIKYVCVPITDGKAPKSSDFDTMAVNIASASKDTTFVFNCQGQDNHWHCYSLSGKTLN